MLAAFAPPHMAMLYFLFIRYPSSGCVLAFPGVCEACSWFWSGSSCRMVSSPTCRHARWRPLTIPDGHGSWPWCHWQGGCFDGLLCAGPSPYASCLLSCAGRAGRAVLLGFATAGSGQMLSVRSCRLSGACRWTLPVIVKVIMLQWHEDQLHATELTA